MARSLSWVPESETFTRAMLARGIPRKTIFTLVDMERIHGVLQASVSGKNGMWWNESQRANTICFPVFANRWAPWSRLAFAVDVATKVMFDISVGDFSPFAAGKLLIILPMVRFVRLAAPHTRPLRTQGCALGGKVRKIPPGGLSNHLRSPLQCAARLVLRDAPATA